MIGKFRAAVGYYWAGEVVPKGSVVLLEDPAAIAELLSAGRLEPADAATAAAIKWNRSTTWTAAPPEDPRWLNVQTGLPRVAAARTAPAGFGPPPWLK